MLATFDYALELVRLDILDAAYLAVHGRGSAAEHWEVHFNLHEQRSMDFTIDGKRVACFASRAEAFGICEALGLTPGMKRPKHELTLRERGFLTAEDARRMLAARALMYYRPVHYEGGLKMMFNRVRGRRTVLVQPVEVGTPVPVFFADPWSLYRVAVLIGFPRLFDDAERQLEAGWPKWYRADEWASDSDDEDA